MATQTLRPNAAGSYSGFSCSGIPYEAVSDQSDSTYIYKGGSSTLDHLFNFASMNAASAIAKITVYARAKETASSDGIYIRVNSSSGVRKSLSGSWVTYSRELTTNPSTGNAWTEDEINALQIGVVGTAVLYGESGYIEVSEVYVVIDYTPAIVPTVTTTTPVTTKDHESATLEGEVTDADGQAITERGFEYKEGLEGEVLTESEEDTDFGEDTYSLEITELSPNTTYYYRAYAVNPSGTGYGDWESFTTDKTTPTVVTNDVSDIDTTIATANGNITATGGENCSERGFQYGLTKVATWTVNDTVGGYSEGAFSKDLTSLTANTIYWIRAYAVNTIGTSYGEWVMFQTAAVGTTPSNTKITLFGDVSGYVSQMHATETDLDEDYEGYFVLSTDLMQGKGLNLYKRLLDLDNYFRKEDSGTVDISIKCDNESAWRSIGSVSLTGDNDIVVPYITPDELGKHFLIKFSGSNLFRYIGTIFSYILQGDR